MTISTETPTSLLTTQDGKLATAPQPLTPEEIADRLVPAGPQISPDGKLVAFTVATVGKKEEHPNQAIWLSRDGKPAAPFTSGTANDSAPRWSPDSQTLAFCSDRAERSTAKLYLIPASGGEAKPLGDLKGELSSPRWSPDGQTIAVLRKDSETDEEKKRKEARDDAIVVDDNLKLTRLWTVDADTGAARCLTHANRQLWGFDWTSDGTNLVILTTASPDLNTIFGAADLWLVPATGGLSRHVGTFPYLPNAICCVDTDQGAAVAAVANGGREDPSESVWVAPLSGEAPRNVLPNYRGIVEEVIADAGTRGCVIARIVEGTHSRLFRLNLDSGDLTAITPSTFGERGSISGGISVAADGNRLACIWNDGSTPQEVYIGEADGTVQPVTEFGKPFADRLNPVEVVQWTSSDGLEIEGLLTYPAGYEAGKRYPLIVEIHGGPSWQWEDRVMLDWHDWAQMLASHGYAVLLPNPRGSTAYGAAFQKLLQNDVGGGEAQDLISGAKALVERGIADPARLGIGGWSWGGYLTAWTITQTDIFQAAVMGAGLSNNVSDHGQDDIPNMNLLIYPGQLYDHLDHYWESSAIRHIKNVRTPTLILHGDADPRVHPAQGMEYHRALKTLGIPVQFVRYPREDHHISERAHQIDLMTRILDWYGKWLGESSANRS